MARLFDSYVIVDWSAASKPSTGADSIWIGVLAPDARLKLAFKSHNPATRAEALTMLQDILSRALHRGDRILLGFDFSLGYPAGAAAALGLEGEPWQAIRKFLLKEMKDKPDNANNRFPLAARMNRLMSGGPFPFWGCSKKDALTTLSQKKSREHEAGEVAEFRLAEQQAIDDGKGRPQPVWKIYYAGAVGGQTLTGIPAVERLREHLPDSKIWPFELPLEELTDESLGDTRVVIAEVYPSMVSVTAESGETRDSAQVRTLSALFAELDANGKLGALFAGKPGLTDEQKALVCAEEGWILGI